MSYLLNNVLAFFDLKCFDLDDYRRKLVPREFALIDDHTTHHGLIDHGCRLDEIPAGDQWNVDITEKLGLGLDFQPTKGDFPEADMEIFLREYYWTHRTSTKYLIGYHHAPAWKMLDQFNIPYIEVDLGSPQSTHCHLHKNQPEGYGTVNYYCALSTVKAMYEKNRSMTRSASSL